VSRRTLAAAVVVAVAFVFYAPTIHDYFTQDDFGVVGLFSQRSLAYLPRWFISPWTEDIWGYVPDEIRPFPAASYVIAAWFGAAAPEPNHILNIAMHAANGVLVMWIAEGAAGLSLLPATFAGVVFVLLPIQAESVAWVTGRVDSLPTFFYFASFLLYVRSVRLKPDTINDGSVRLQADYWWSIALFFTALFSKQNTITMVPALVLFDWLIARRRIELSWRWLRPYVPYILLTIGFLALRYLLFQEVAREGILNAQRIREFLSDSSRHLVRLVAGGPGVRHWMWKDTAWIAFPAAVIAIRPRLWRPAIYFAVVWMVLGIVPILMSGYYSPRHMYLASLGWALTLAIAIEAVCELNGHRVTRVAVAVAATAVAVTYAIQLHAAVFEWNRYAAISHAAVTQIEREAASNPAGTLIIAGVPRLSWAFAVPYSVRPPFTPTDLTTRVSVISDSSDHCCNAVLWEEYTRARLRQWHDRSDRPPVVALFWNPQTQRMSRVSDADDPQLRTLAGLLLETKNREGLDGILRGLLTDYVALR
jgi:hypothetical protein